ncbi:MAG TPA: hypothetical protein DET40_19275 [Lentisphaeria bacterium]|nr:MAG: hypothetical protein A2X45_18105 [Lentisphaerae bacterium GWF2_50_93]HCE45690.1 hypothetical protein [Lentisphaeria bacterium]
MKIILLNSVLLPMLALILLPLMIHLFAKGRPRVHMYSSIEFILRIMKNTMRIKKPQDYILLVLRTLFVAALILVFLQPLLFTGGKTSGMFRRNNIAVIVDSTASMAVIDGAQTRFAAACAEASEILSGLGSKDTANVVWLNSKPSSIFPEMGVNFTYLRGELQKAQVTSEAGDIREAVRMAAAMLDGTEGRKEICVVSDFQKAAWEKIILDVPEDVEIVKIKVGGGDAPNLAVTSFRCEPPLPLCGEEISFYCEVNNYSSQPRQTTLFFSVQESRQSREIMLPPQGRATAMFKHAFAQPGISKATVFLNEDSFTGDDRRFLSVNVSQSLRVGILPDEKSTAKAWKRALDSLTWARAEFISEKDLAGDLPYDVLMLAGWKGNGAEALSEKLKQGACIICMPGEVADLSGIIQLSGRSDSADFAKQAVRYEKSEDRTHRLKISNGKDEMFRLFEDGGSVNPAAGIFKGRIVFPKWPFENEVLLSYDDNMPALIKMRNSGILFIWNMPLGRDFSTMHAQPGFLPFIAELMLSSRNPGRTGPAETVEFFPGDSMTLRMDRDSLGSDISLRDENEKEIPVEIKRSGGKAYFVTAPIRSTGFYTWKYRGRDTGAGVVNFPPVESDLASVPAELAARTKDSVIVSGGSDVRRMRDGLNLWPMILLAALGLALAEGLALFWVERT